jgi:hypothetical protein
MHLQKKLDTKLDVKPPDWEINAEAMRKKKTAQPRVTITHSTDSQSYTTVWILHFACTL